MPIAADSVSAPATSPAAVPGVVIEQQRDPVRDEQPAIATIAASAACASPSLRSPRKNCGPVRKPIANRNSRKKHCLTCVRHRDAELAHDHAGEQRPGHGAELETAERDLAEQVAEAEHEEESDLGMGTQQVLQPGRHGLSSCACDGGRRRVEPAAEREVEVDALHEPLGLHAHERGSRAVHGELLLLDAAQVAGADVVANPRQLERLLILGRRAGEHLLAPAGGELGGERVLDLAERARADPAVVRDRLALLGGADPDLRLRARRR